jgi:hypothetical protein
MHTDAKRHHVLVNVYDHVHANALWLFKASLRTSQQTSQHPWTRTVFTSFSSTNLDTKKRPRIQGLFPKLLLMHLTKHIPPPAASDLHIFHIWSLNLTINHSIVMYVKCRCQWTPHLPHLGKIQGSYACLNIRSPGSHSQLTVDRGH